MLPDDVVFFAARIIAAKRGRHDDENVTVPIFWRCFYSKTTKIYFDILKVLFGLFH